MLNTNIRTVIMNAFDYVSRVVVFRMHTFMAPLCPKMTTIEKDKKSIHRYQFV